MDIYNPEDFTHYRIFRHAYQVYHKPSDQWISPSTLRGKLTAPLDMKSLEIVGAGIPPIRMKIKTEENKVEQPKPLMEEPLSVKVEEDREDFEYKDDSGGSEDQKEDKVVYKFEKTKLSCSFEERLQRLHN